MSMDPFDSAELYDARDDGENLTYDSVEEALQRRMDVCGEPGETLRDTIRREAPITVDAYVSAKVHATEVWACKMVASREFTAAQLEEMFAEEIAKEDGHG